MKFRIQMFDGSLVELSGVTVMDVDYGGTPLPPGGYAPITMTLVDVPRRIPSRFRRIGETVIVEGRDAVIHDLPRATEWAKENGIEVLDDPDDDRQTVYLFFTNEPDAILAMVALS